MSSAIIGLIAAIASYLVGSVPFGLVTARVVAGVDIRTRGSGNIGATNVARVLGGKWGVVVLLLDVLKGVLPVAASLAVQASTPSDLFKAEFQRLLPQSLIVEPCPHLPVLCGVATIVGHMFPCWLRFRGGKGVATALGVVLVLAPWGMLAALLAFVLTFAASRIVALSSVVAAVAFAVAQMLLIRPNPFTAETWSLGVFSVAVPLLIIARHRSNLRRLLRGEEAKFQLGGRE